MSWDLDAYYDQPPENNNDGPFKTLLKLALVWVIVLSFVIGFGYYLVMVVDADKI